MRKILIGLCLAAGLSGSARTLVWYHFNEGAVGETTTSPGEKTIVNAAETGSVYDGRVWTCPANGSTSNRAMSATSEYVGTYSEGFPSSVRVIDPQTGAVFTNERSLYLGSAARTGAGKSVMITIDDAAELHVSNITVEAFVKFDDPITNGTWRTIAMKQTDAINGRVSWGLRVGGTGGLNSQTDGRKVDGSFESTSANVSSPSIFDGKWHHVAMVVDGEAMTQTIYLDYRLIKSAALKHPIDYTGDDPIVIGNTVYASYGCFGGGWIDEFRLSDTALHPSQFIRFRTRPDELVDDDTVIYLTFDAHSWFGGTYLHNEAFGASATNAVLKINTGTATLEANEVPGAGVVRDGIYGEETSNLGVFHFQTNNTAMKSAYILVDDLTRSIGAGTFTVEGFFRWSPANLGRSNPHYFFTEHHPSKGRAIDVYFDSLGRLNSYVIAKGMSNLVDEVTGEVTNTVEIAVSKAVAKNKGAYYDDVWHHLAFVYDQEEQTAKVYMDYALLGTATDVAELYVELLHASYENNFMIGTGYGTGAYNMNGGYMDEIRITKRALAAQEFLMRDAAPTFTTNTLAWYTFEDADLIPEPRAESRVPSVTGTYSFSDEVPGGKHTIITDGYGNELRHGNTRSLKLTKGSSAFRTIRDLPLENHDEVTVEFFAKSTDAKQYNTVVTYQGVRRGHEGGTYDGTIASPSTLWAVQGAAGNKRYRTHIVTTANSNFGMTGNSEAEAAVDGKWHHIAATFQNEGTTKVRTTLYCDYELASTSTTSGQMRTDLIYSQLLVGGGIEGVIDEIRISEGVLPIEAFLRRQTLGMMIIFK